MKTEKSNRLRGTVLFTVVCVMALLIIFLTGTLALATASSNRAHKSYSSSQASYTAKTAITGFTEAMSRNSDVAKSVKNLGIGSNPSVIYPEVKINKGSTNETDKTVGLIGYWNNSGKWEDNKIIVEKVGGTGQYAFDLDPHSKNYQKWVSVDLVRITATARVGKEESTVTAYIKKRPAENLEDSPTIPSGIKGFNTIGDGNFANGGRLTGGLGVGLKSNIKKTYYLNNDTEIDTTLTFINGDVLAATSSFAFDVHEQADRPVQETVIKGNLWMKNGQNDPLIQLDYKMHKDYKQQQIPYFYVDGVLGFSSQCTLVATVDADHRSPYNIFCGTLMADKNEYTTQSADIYMMDEYTGDAKKYEGIKTDGDWQGNFTSSVDIVKGDNYYGNGGQSKVLYKWADSVLNKTQNQNKSYGSNMYCNGQLHLNNVTIDGDVRVKKNCYINNVTIKGDLVVGGDLYVNGNLSANRIFCDPSKVHDYSKTSAPADETFKTVDNFFHIPPELEAFKDDLSSLEAYKVDFTKRNLFVWDPSAHKDASGHMTQLNGNTADDPYTLYYWWKDEYAPDIRIYEGDTGFKYVKPGEAFNDEGYTYLGTVKDILDALLESETFLRDDVTLDVIDKFIDVKSVKYSSELPRVDGEVRTWYYTLPEYVGDDESGKPMFRETSVKTDFECGYYIPTNNPEHKFITELPYYTVKAYDETTDTGIRTFDKQTIYSNNEPHLVVDQSYVNSQSQIKTQSAIQGNIYNYSAYGQPAYPVNMERDAIYADKGTPTKIIRTLTEVRNDMNLDKLEESYPYDVPIEGGHRTACAANIEYDGSDAAHRNTTITNDATIKNDVDGVTINIDPKGKTIWVVLENVTMKNNADIIVDLTQGGKTPPAGKVCFLVKGTLNLSTHNSIVNKEITTNKCEFDSNKDWGMEFYGQKEDNTATPPIKTSKIMVNGMSTITGAFKCPYTDFACDNFGKYEVLYTDEYGVRWWDKNKQDSKGNYGDKNSGSNRGNDLTQHKPPIVGNALFKDVITQGQYGPINMNLFGMFYTKCGQSGSSVGGGGQSGGPISTTEGIFDLIYYSGV